MSSLTSSTVSVDTLSLGGYSASSIRTSSSSSTSYSTLATCGWVMSRGFSTGSSSASYSVRTGNFSTAFSSSAKKLDWGFSDQVNLSSFSFPSGSWSGFHGSSGFGIIFQSVASVRVSDGYVRGMLACRTN